MKPTMTILRAKRELEMDVDIDHTTEINHMERDNPEQITLYGTESDGTLWYIVLNQETINQIKAL